MPILQGLNICEINEYQGVTDSSLWSLNLTLHKLDLAEYSLGSSKLSFSPHVAKILQILAKKRF